MRAGNVALAGWIVLAIACRDEHRTEATPDPECEGLVPEGPGPGPSATGNTGGIAACLGAITDGTGELVGLGWGHHYLTYSLYPAGGGTSVGEIRALGPGYGMTIPPRGLIVPQPHGFHAANAPDGFPQFVAYDSRGREISRGTTLGEPFRIADDPDGGSALLTSTSRLSPDSPVTRLERVDESGRLVATAELERDGAIVGVARSGNALVIVGDGMARWFDRKAMPLTDWFDVGIPLPSPSRVPAAWALWRVADGSLAARSLDAWEAVFADGDAKASSPPAWLAERPWADAYVVRGGRATAVAWNGTDATYPSAPGYPACRATEVEIFTASGHRCGSVKLPAADCSWVGIGKDGTVIAQLQERHSPNDCVWQWWPALLR